MPPSPPTPSSPAPSSTSTPPPSPRLKRTFLLLAASLLPLLLLEAAARLLYREPWYERLLGEQVERALKPYRKNRWELRDRDYDEPKLATTRRVLMLGDSFAYGDGVFDEDAILPELLEKELNATRPVPGVAQVDVLNAAIPGSLTDAWVTTYKKVAREFQPDVVLFVFFLRDGTKIGSLGAFFYPIRDQIVVRNRKSPLYRHCFLFRTLRDALDRRWIQESYIDRFQRSYFGDESETEEWRAAQENLRDIRRRAENRGARVGFVVFPVLAELDENYPFRGICDELMRFAAAEGMPALSLLDAYLGKKDADLWVSPLNQHPNAGGHRIAADAVLPFLIELLRAEAPR